MKIPSIRAKIGNWTYYISSLSFLQVSQLVRKIDAELHGRPCWREWPGSFDPGQHSIVTTEAKIAAGASARRAGTAVRRSVARNSRRILLFGTTAQRLDETQRQFGRRVR